ncbi:MAG: flavin reductase family protein [archaeon]|nr:flavin reductase family protein [archaeon]
MRKNFGAKPLMYPMPVYMIASYGSDGTPNVMNAAWGGIIGENRVAICVDRSHKTTENVVARKAFTVSVATVDQTVACDYVGIVSGNDVPDKFARAGFHAERSEFVDAPLIRELPMALECRLISYDPETEVMLGEIVNVCADESVLTDGRIDPMKVRPIIYDSSMKGYYSMTEKVGSAFKDGKQIQ